VPALRAALPVSIRSQAYVWDVPAFGLCMPVPASFSAGCSPDHAPAPDGWPGSAPFGEIPKRKRHHKRYARIAVVAWSAARPRRGRIWAPAGKPANHCRPLNRFTEQPQERQFSASAARTRDRPLPVRGSAGGSTPFLVAESILSGTGVGILHCRIAPDGLPVLDRNSEILSAQTPANNQHGGRDAEAPTFYRRYFADDK
jgi:hypothetical protein